MVDYTELALLATSGFFVVLSFSLLYRYRQVSQRIADSTDMGKDLWQALEQRMRKQDERIIDVMTKFDVVQARLVVSPSVQPAGQPGGVQVEPFVPVAQSQRVQEQRDEVVTPAPMQPPASQGQSQVESSSKSALKLDDTELKAIQLLSNGDLDTRKITDALAKSREHTARVMKSLFEQGLVTRDDSKKPFVYKLTDLGRKLLPQP